MQVIYIGNVSEILNFLTVIEFNTKFGKKCWQEPTRYFNAADIQKSTYPSSGHKMKEKWNWPPRYSMYFPYI